MNRFSESAEQIKIFLLYNFRRKCINALFLLEEVKEIYNIGDSNGGGIIPNAVCDGYTVGNLI